jgi:hypothetical protein
MTSTRHITLAAAALTLASCDSSGRPAHGEASSLIIVAADSVWGAVEENVRGALQPRIFTVRDENTFEITQISPTDPAWTDLRRFRQVLPIGVAGDFWVAPAVDAADLGALPTIVETQDVWARGQGVTSIVVDAADPVGGVNAVLAQLGELLDRRYREYALSRMFVTDRNTALRDSLIGTAGYALTLPNVWRRTDLGTIQVFRNHSDMGSELRRTLTVTWRAGVDEDLSTDRIIAWRDSVAAVAMDLPQVTSQERLESRSLQSQRGTEVQGVWSSTDPTWPAGGPLVTRVIVCPEQDRTYLLDAWLYAPGRKKYEYMIQIETLLDSFRCGDGRGGTAAGA